MTKEELEKATGQELIEQRDYCGVDGYYGDCLNDVNAEMLKRFNRLVDLEKENAELKARLNAIKMLTPELEKSSKLIKQQLTRAKDLLNEFMRISKAIDEDFDHDYSELIGETEIFLKEVEK